MGGAGLRLQSRMVEEWRVVLRLHAFGRGAETGLNVAILAPHDRIGRAQSFAQQCFDAVT
jgi:hypothetical protein